MVRWRIRLIGCAVAILLPLVSCGYSFKGRSAGDIKRIAVPYLSNATAQPEIEIEITRSIIDGLVKDNTLKVVTGSEADAVLEGTAAYNSITFVRTPKELIAS